MTSVTLIGVDPGIRDTAATVVRMDNHNRTWSVGWRVWSGVTTRDKFKITINPQYLKELTELMKRETAANGATFAGVEAFRQRGTNPTQDRNMLDLVQSTQRALPGSIIVDNTSMKKIVTEDLLALFNMSRFPGTNHADIKSGGRVALRLGISIPAINTIVSDFVRDNVVIGEPWSLDSMQAL